MSNPLPNTDHVIILMLENRSFDNLAGWLYTLDDPPEHIISPQPQPFQGLDGVGFSNPTSFSNGIEIPAQRGTHQAAGAFGVAFRPRQNPIRRHRLSFQGLKEIAAAEPSQIPKRPP